MENYVEYIIPVLAIAMLTAGWMLVQLVAKKMGTKNHIDLASGGGQSCCGDCEKRDTCNKL